MSPTPARAHPQAQTSDPPGESAACDAPRGGDGRRVTTPEATMSTTEVGSDDATRGRCGTLEPICAGTRPVRP
jgi:hypothetical protein